MCRRTFAKHSAAEPDWSVPVPDTWERAAKIAVPVLAVTGSLDSPDHIGMAKRFARLVTDGRVSTIEGTAHYPNTERPQAFEQAVTEFLRGSS
jgi:pimeloyl-ACP methyl ester carboxylesterase